jgi:protein TonB
MRWTGTVQVSFLVSEKGAVQRLEVRSSCGYPLLDREALQAVRRAAPFAAPTQATAVVLPIVFALR